MEPVSAIAGAIGAVANMVTASIPSDELKRERFKVRYPIIYANIRMRMYKKCLRHLRFRWHEDIDSFVKLTAAAFPKDEQEYMILLLHKTLHR